MPTPTTHRLASRRGRCCHLQQPQPWVMRLQQSTSCSHGTSDTLCSSCTKAPPPPRHLARCLSLSIPSSAAVHTLRSRVSSSWQHPSPRTKSRDEVRALVMRLRDAARASYERILASTREEVSRCCASFSTSTCAVVVRHSLLSKLEPSLQHGSPRLCHLRAPCSRPSPRPPPEGPAVPPAPPPSAFPSAFPSALRGFRKAKPRACPSYPAQHLARMRAWPPAGAERTAD
jgi:hypothetical protein